jgi:hypothetical protein
VVVTVALMFVPGRGPVRNADGFAWVDLAAGPGDQLDRPGSVRVPYHLAP